MRWIQSCAIYCLLGVLIGFAVGYGISVLNNDGFFTSWHRLTSGVRFKEITDISSEALWAQATDGTLYSWEFDCFQTPDCNVWTKSKSLPAESPAAGRLVRKSDSCLFPEFRLMRKPPSNHLACEQVQILGPEFGDTYYFVLLEDGSIWLWDFSSSLIVDIHLQLLCPSVGLVIAIIVFVLVMIRGTTEQEVRAGNSPEDG
jgi:hypothetical protein